jgi:hypothetical protein
MFVYVLKCAAVLIGLWFARYFQLIPWSTLVNILSTVIVPIVLIAIGLWRAERQNADRVASETLKAVKHYLTQRL